MARLAPDKVFRLLLLDLGDAIAHEGTTPDAADAEAQLHFIDGHPIEKPEVRAIIDAARTVYAAIRREQEAT